MQKEKSSKLITPEQRSEIERLHRECEKAHRQTKRSTYDKLKKLFVEEWAFGKPVIPSPSAGEQWKYTYLLALLRASDTDTKLYVLANWLKHENVCRPRELLPQQVFARVTAEQSKRVERFGWNDFYYGRVIQAWLPYCESLLSDMRAAAQGGWDQAVHLRELGYDPDLVALALSRRMGGRPRRSATELACEWVAQQNWVEVAKKRQDPDSPKRCEMRIRE